MASVILRPKTKEYLEGLKEVMDGSALALQDGYKYLFLSEVTHLLTAYDYSLEDIRKILSGQQPSTQYPPFSRVRGANGAAAESGSKVNTAVKTVTRKEKRYRNPHTGETISLRSSKNKVLKRWQEEYGVDAVEQWRVS
ncbi:DNA binding protein [Pseudomonas sp. B26(2017)]|uniref:DNA binding protein n=1 Tax=Pseudomonas sp. B26(2017) TaxID=1981732 RepID=UPI000A1EF4BE|nr:DNA binding protein [Pseudomonas sp. B26(2017)]